METSNSMKKMNRKGGEVVPKPTAPEDPSATRKKLRKMTIANTIPGRSKAVWKEHKNNERERERGGNRNDTIRVFLFQFSPCMSLYVVAEK
jgi:hypothetical protein